MKKTSAHLPLVLRVMIDSRSSTSDAQCLIATVGLTEEALKEHWGDLVQTRLGRLRLRDLQIMTYVDSRVGSTYSGEIRYRDVYAANLRETEQMLVTLRAFDKALVKAQETQGYAPTWADTVLRVALALKVERVDIHTAVFGAANKLQWVNSEWHSGNVATGVDTLRRLITEIGSRRAA